MIRLLYFIFLIVSVVIYVYHPVGYSIEFCSLVTTLYISQGLFYLSHSQRFGFLSFDTFFLISLLLACFAYPVFFPDINIRNFSNINLNVINKATALSLVGANAYMFGSILKINKVKYIVKNKIEFDLGVVKKNGTILIVMSYILFFIFVFVGGLSYLEAYKDITNPNLKIALEYLEWLKIVFVVCTVFVFLYISKHSTLRVILSKIDKRYLILYSIIILILLIGGTRNLPIQMLLVILCVYNLLIKRIHSSKVILMVVVGFIFFTIIRIGRGDFSDGKTAFSGEIVLNDQTDSSTFVSDFIGASAPLYTLVDQTDLNGINYGQSMLLPVLGVVPFLQSITLAVFGLDNEGYFLSSSLLSTEIIFDSFETGAGTNIIGDLYFSFGFFGVLFFMFSLGFIVRFFTNKIIETNDLASIVAYVCIFSLSLFIVRVEFTFFMRYLVWSVMLLKILTYLNKRKLV